VFDGFSSAPEYLASAFRGADSNVLAGVCGAFAQVGGCVDGMKGYQVGGGFACSFSCAAYTFRRTSADVSRARAHVALRAGVGFGVGP
jgi:predicted DNA-binding helix-hairpin-helix protein